MDGTFPKASSTFHFLPPDIDPNFYRYTNYSDKSRFVYAETHESAFEKISQLDPNAIVRNVRIHYGYSTKERHHQGGEYVQTEGTSFMHHEVSAQKCLELLKCCDPNSKMKPEEVQRCWNRAFPGNLSDFNIYGHTFEELDPLVRKNFLAYYPPPSINGIKYDPKKPPEYYFKYNYSGRFLYKFSRLVKFKDQA